METEARALQLAGNVLIAAASGVLGAVLGSSAAGKERFAGPLLAAALVCIVIGSALAMVAGVRGRASSRAAGTPVSTSTEDASVRAGSQH